MRVHCSGLDGNDIEGEVIGGEFYDPDTGHCDLEDTFTVRRDDGMVFEVHGWLVDVTVMVEKQRLVMEAWRKRSRECCIVDAGERRSLPTASA